MEIKLFHRKLARRIDKNFFIAKYLTFITAAKRCKKKKKVMR
jgi:hypothetical protein